MDIHVITWEPWDAKRKLKIAQWVKREEWIEYVFVDELRNRNLFKQSKGGDYFVGINSKLGPQPNHHVGLLVGHFMSNHHCTTSLRVTW